MTTHRTSRKKLYTAAAIGAAALSTAAQRCARADSSGISFTGPSISENFNALPTSPQNGYLQSDGTGSTPLLATWNDNSTLPGWYAYSTGLSSPLTPGVLGLNVGDGTPKSTTWNGTTITSGKTTLSGGLYDFGQTIAGGVGVNSVGGPDRALGAAATGTSGQVTYGIKLINNTTQTYSSITVGYTGQEWFSGFDTTAGRGLSFLYGINQPGINPAAGGANYTPDSTLNFGPSPNALPVAGGGPGPVNPSPGSRAGTALNGNLAANQKQLTDTIPLTWAPGQSLWLAWSRLDTSAGGPGVAIDNLNFAATALPPTAHFLTWSPPSVNPASTKWNTVAANTNWTDNKNGNAPIGFTNADIVNFTDSGVGPVNVDAGGVSASAINVSNTTGTYTFSGGSVSGGLLTKTNAGTLALMSTNGFTGLDVQGGTVQTSADANLGDPQGGVSLNGGSTFQTTAPITSARTFQIGSNGATIDTNSFNSSLSGSFAMNGAFVKKGAGSLTLSGPLASSIGSSVSILGGSLVMSQTDTGVQDIIASGGGQFIGDLVINGPMRFSINGGTVSGGGKVNVQANSAGIIVQTPVGGVPGTTTTTISNAIVLNSAGAPNTLANPFNVFLGASTAGNTLVIDTNGISGNANVLFTNDILKGGGAGTVDLKVANSWTGNTIVNNSGTIIVDAAGAIPAGTALTFGDGVNTGGIGQIDLAGHDLNVSSLGSNLGKPTQAVGGITNSTNALSTVIIKGAAITNFNGVIGLNNSVNGSTDSLALTLDAANTGALTLTGPNTYTGGTTINGGTLDIETAVTLNGNVSSLPANANVTNNANLIVNDGQTTAHQILGLGVTTIGPTGNVSVGTLTQTSVTNNGALAVNTGGTVGPLDGAGNTTVANAASFTAGHVRQSALTVNGTLTITKAATPQAAASTSIVSSLTLGGPVNAWTGKVDLQNDALVVNTTSVANRSAAAATIYSEIKEAAHNTGAGAKWDGMGGITSGLLTGGSPKFGIGVAENTAGLTSFGGQSVNANSVLVGYTLLGDTDMSAKVDFTDLGNLLNHYKQAGTWQQGDFNYDGKVDFTDLGILLNNYKQSLIPLTPAINASTLHLDAAAVQLLDSRGFTVVPEPSSLTLAAAGALLLGRRRRRTAR